MKNVKACGILGDKSFYIDIKDEESDDNIINDFNLISNHMKDLSETFDKLKNHSKEEGYSKDIQNLYKNLKSVFNSWSTSYLNQSKFFKDDFWEFFNYNYLEYNEFETINYIDGFDPKHCEINDINELYNIYCFESYLNR